MRLLSGGRHVSLNDVFFRSCLTDANLCQLFDDFDCRNYRKSNAGACQQLVCAQPDDTEKILHEQHIDSCQQLSSSARLALCTKPLSARVSMVGSFHTCALWRAMLRSIVDAYAFELCLPNSLTA